MAGVEPQKKRTLGRFACSTGDLDQLLRASWLRAAAQPPAAAPGCWGSGRWPLRLHEPRTHCGRRSPEVKRTRTVGSGPPTPDRWAHGGRVRNRRASNWVQMEPELIAQLGDFSTCYRSVKRPTRTASGPPAPPSSSLSRCQLGQ